MMNISAVQTTLGYEQCRSGVISVGSWMIGLTGAVVLSVGGPPPRGREVEDFVDVISGLTRSLTSDEQSYRTARWLGKEKRAWAEKRTWSVIGCGVLLRLMGVQHLAMKILVEIPSQALYWSYKSCTNLRYLFLNKKFNFTVITNNAKIAGTTGLLAVQDVFQDFLQILIPELASDNARMRRFYNKNRITRMHAVVDHVPKVLSDVINAVNVQLENDLKLDEREVCFEFYKKMRRRAKSSNEFLDQPLNSLLALKIYHESMQFLRSEELDTFLLEHLQKRAGELPEGTQGRITQGRVAFFTDHLSGVGIRLPASRVRGRQVPREAFARVFVQSLGYARTFLIDNNKFTPDEIEGMVGEPYNAMINMGILDLLRRGNRTGETIMVGSQRFSAVDWRELYTPLCDAKTLFDGLDEDNRGLLKDKLLGDSESEDAAIMPLFRKIGELNCLINQRVMSVTRVVNWVDAFYPAVGQVNG